MPAGGKADGALPGGLTRMLHQPNNAKPVVDGYRYGFCPVEPIYEKYSLYLALFYSDSRGFSLAVAGFSLK